TVRVFDRETPIADLTPCSSTATDEAGEAQLAALERSGVLRRATAELPDDFLTRRLPRAKSSVVKALLDERREGFRIRPTA
ncbi:MAG TPA: hypothetical protein VFZ65_23055, partial [Planctomycetota bacterium]|nr:hypothetical protein [Planctomycetota bacterium]